MKYLTALLSLLVGLIAGLGVSHLTREQLPALPAGSPAVDSSVDLSPGVSSASPIVEFTLDELLAALPLAEPAAGAGIIEGTVVTSAGEPLAGVAVRATIASKIASLEGKDISTFELQDYLALEVEQYQHERAHVLTATTDGAGRFVLEGVVDAPYRCELSKKHYRIEPEDHADGLSSAGVAQTWIARPTAPVEIVIKNEHESEEVQHASIWASAPDPDGVATPRGVSLRWSREAPVVSIPVDLKQVSSDGGNAPLDLVHREPATVTITHQEEFEIFARVDGPSLSHLETVVSARLLPADESGSPGEWARDSRLRNHGRLHIVELNEPGRYEVILVPTNPEYYDSPEELAADVLDSTILEVTDKTAFITLTMPAHSQEKLLFVTAFGPDGNKLTRLEMSVYATSDYGSLDRQHFLADGTGQFVIPIPPNAQGRSSLSIWARSSEYGTLKTSFEVTESAEVRLQFEEEAVLHLRVSGEVPRALRGRLRVQLYRADPSMTERVQRLSLDSTLTARGLPPGDYLAEVFLERSGLQTRQTLMTRSFELHPGSNRIDLPYPELCTVRVHYPEEFRGQRVVLMHLGQEQIMNFAVVDKNGTASFHYVAPGLFAVASPGGAEMYGTATHLDQQLRFTPTTVNALEVRGLSAGHLLADSGLRNGDLIVSVNGRSLSDQGELRRTLRGSRLDEGTRYHVLRAGKEAEILLRVSRSNYYKPLGDVLYPVSR